MTVLALLTAHLSLPAIYPRIIREHLSHDLEYAVPSALVAGLISKLKTLKLIFRSC